MKWELKRVELFEEKHDFDFSAAQGPDAISQFEEMFKDVQNAVNTLPIQRRKIYRMNRFDRKHYQEIADELRLSVKPVEVRLYRANKFVRALLKEKS